jgi:hypothetical protein
MFDCLELMINNFEHFKTCVLTSTNEDCCSPMILNYNSKTIIKECELAISGVVTIATNKFIKFIANNTTIVTLNCFDCYKITDDELISLVTAQPAHTQTLRYFIYCSRESGVCNTPTIKKMLKLTKNLKFCFNFCYIRSKPSKEKVEKIQNENPTRFFIEG